MSEPMLAELARRPEAWLAVGFLAGGVAGAAGGSVVTQHVIHGPHGSNAVWGFIFEVAQLTWTLLWAGGIMLGIVVLGSRLARGDPRERAEVATASPINPGQAFGDQRGLVSSSWGILERSGKKLDSF